MKTIAIIVLAAWPFILGVLYWLVSRNTLPLMYKPTAEKVVWFTVGNYAAELALLFVTGGNLLASAGIGMFFLTLHFFYRMMEMLWRR